MITSKQRSNLRKTANSLNAAFQIGKSGLTPEIVKAIDEYLEANEIVKIGILENCDEPPEKAAEVLSGRTRSDIVQVIGKKIVLFRRSKKKPVIEL